VLTKLILYIGIIKIQVKVKMNTTIKKFHLLDFFSQSYNLS